MTPTPSSAASPPTQAILRSLALQPGDVLLSRAQGWRSTVVARATGGPFSHAAIWLPDDILPTLYEADGQGVGPTHLQPVHVRDGVHAEMGYLLPGEPGDFALWRHPGVSALSPVQLQRAACALRDQAVYRRYARLHRLSHTLAGQGLRARALRATARLALPLIDPRAHEAGHAGIFCSEFVCLYFRLLGLPLFTHERAPDTVSPNHLAGRDSLLREVDGAFIRPRAGLQMDVGIHVPTAKLRAQIDAVSRHKQAAEVFAARADAFGREVMARCLAQGRELAATKQGFIEDEVRLHHDQTRMAGEEVYRRRLPHLLRMMVTQQGCTCLQDWTTRQHGLLPPEQQPHLLQAYGCLLQKLEEDWQAAQHAFLRAAVLDALRLQRQHVRSGLDARDALRQSQRQLLPLARPRPAPPPAVEPFAWLAAPQAEQQAERWPLIQAFTAHWLAQPLPTL